jgi:hypothetical protein
MARGYLSQRFDPLTVGAEIVRLRDATDRLVRTEWAQHRIRAVAAALLRHVTLTGDEIGVMIRHQCQNAASRRPGPVEELEACFVVKDRVGQKLAYVCFEDEPRRRSAAKLLSKDRRGGLLPTSPSCRSYCGSIIPNGRLAM